METLFAFKSVQFTQYSTKRYKATNVSVAYCPIWVGLDFLTVGLHRSVDKYHDLVVNIAVDVGLKSNMSAGRPARH
jgi:hypothetical protein